MLSEWAPLALEEKLQLLKTGVHCCPSENTCNVCTIWLNIWQFTKSNPFYIYIYTLHRQYHTQSEDKEISLTSLFRKLMLSSHFSSVVLPECHFETQSVSVNIQALWYIYTSCIFYISKSVYTTLDCVRSNLTLPCQCLYLFLHVLCLKCNKTSLHWRA